MADSPLFFQISSVFIGANLGLAAITFIQNTSKDVLSDISEKTRFLILVLTFGAAWLSVISSDWLFGSYTLARASVVILALSYSLTIITCSYYLYLGKRNKIKKAASVINKNFINE